MSDQMMGDVFGVKASQIKKLRKVFGVAGLQPNFRNPRKGRPKAHTLAGWPKVMSAEVRDKRWKKYFAQLGRDHSDGDVRVRPTRQLARPDISHLHGLGGSSLNF